MYSDMSKRMSGTPRMRASCRASSVLPTPVGPEKRKLPIGEVLGRQLDGGLERLLGELPPVVLLVTRLEALEDLPRFIVPRLEDLDLLEGACEWLGPGETRL